ncbi:cation diffusion facilitator family transporter [Lacrimispora sp. 210928-DFI.3.58]|uniref:cation diffusion facilitator family transporter n=1 Tax=Lacrimispora sp. 210928-DFI.3.58 TaxID=2883214 RepID=UPI0015B57F1A|nr:cation diffusion facilitator family transporter [Lacrimispora sp. 210928-DFI.3.58]MCB7320418.1 cation diffusion facilitator family transporter [Lacrimispora sp. 210928-DFI.3.58]
MTELLVKRFVKNYEQVEDAGVRTSYGTLASMVGIFCNILLFCGKLFIGVLVNSISVMADAFNNLSDAASSIIGFVGVKMAEKPADDDHPFGHGRIEYIAAFIVAFLVIQVGFSLFKTSLGKVFHPETLTFKWVSLLILVLSVCVKLWLSAFNRRLGNRINSKVMLATAADAMGDVATTSSTILSIGVYGLLGWNIDGIVGLVVSVVVMIAGVNIAKDTLAPLIGEAIDPELYNQITNFVEGFDGIVGTHDLIVHNYGPSKSMASIHAEVPNDRDIEISHEIIDRIEREAYRRFGLMLVIHMDPVETHDERVLQFKSMVLEVLGEIDSRLSFHDFRMVDGVERINLIFDLVVPREYKPDILGKLKVRISDEVRRRDKRCVCVITIENSFLSGA